MTCYTLYTSRQRSICRKIVVYVVYIVRQVEQLRMPCGVYNRTI